MQVDEFLKTFPDVKKVIIVLSGGLDSTTALYLAVRKYGAENVGAITFNYGQKQAIEIEAAKKSTAHLGVEHRVVDMSFLGEVLAKGSTNIKGASDKTPTVKEVLGDPQPTTYVPFRNMMLCSIGFCYAECFGAEAIFLGIQSNDAFCYWDTTTQYQNAINAVASLNRKNQIKLVAPFVSLRKEKEIALGNQIGVHYEWTFSCYDPKDGISCGVCPSCADRMKAFLNNGLKDPLPYAVEVPWDKMISEFTKPFIRREEQRRMLHGKIDPVGHP